MLVPIDRARDGEHVRLVGRAHARGELLVAPSSGIGCVAYEVVILIDEPGSAGPRALVVERHVTHVALEDETGRVDLASEIAFAPSATNRKRVALGERASSILARVGEPVREHLVCFESIVHAGDFLAARGVLRVRGKARSLEARPGDVVTVSDDPEMLR